MRARGILGPPRVARLGLWVQVTGFPGVGARIQVSLRGEIDDSGLRQERAVRFLALRVYRGLGFRVVQGL